MTYDELGHLLKSIGAATQTTSYANDRTVNLTPNALDKVTAYQDPRLITISYVHNRFGEMIQELSRRPAKSYLLLDPHQRTSRKRAHIQASQVQ